MNYRWILLLAATMLIGSTTGLAQRRGMPPGPGKCCGKSAAIAPQSMNPASAIKTRTQANRRNMTNLKRDAGPCPSA